MPVLIGLILSHPEQRLSYSELRLNHLESRLSHPKSRLILPVSRLSNSNQNWVIPEASLKVDRTRHLYYLRYSDISIFWSGRLQLPLNKICLHSSETINNNETMICLISFTILLNFNVFRIRKNTWRLPTGRGEGMGEIFREYFYKYNSRLTEPDLQDFHWQDSRMVWSRWWICVMFSVLARLLLNKVRNSKAFICSHQSERGERLIVIIESNYF